MTAFLHERFLASESTSEMKSINQSQIVRSEHALIGFGNFLITYYLDSDQEEHSESQIPQRFPDLLDQLEALLAAFLDKSTTTFATLVDFREGKDGAFTLEYETSSENTQSIEKLLRDFFQSAKAYIPYIVRREHHPKLEQFRIIPS